MDILIAVLGTAIMAVTAILIFTTIFGVVCLEDPRTQSALKYVLSIMAAMIGLLIWDYQAVTAHESNPANTTNISCPIQHAFNSAFYVDENGKPHEITGDARFADPTTSEMVIKTLKGGWKYGIYVSGDRRVSMQKKGLAEAK